MDKVPKTWPLSFSLKNKNKLASSIYLQLNKKFTQIKENFFSDKS